MFQALVTWIHRFCFLGKTHSLTWVIVADGPPRSEEAPAPAVVLILLQAFWYPPSALTAFSTASRLEANRKFRWIFEPNKVSCKINLIFEVFNYSLWIWQAGLLSALGSLGLMIWLMAIPHSHETEQKRLGLLAGFSFLTGMFRNWSNFEGRGTVILVSL